MRIKYRYSEEFYPIDDYKYINAQRVRLYGSNIPTSSEGFYVYADDENCTQLYINKDHIVLYEQTDEYVEYTTDTSIYNVFCIYDPESLYVTGQIASVADEIMYGVLMKSGRGKEFHNPSPIYEYIDENGFYNYKIDGLETLNIVEVTSDEKQELLDEMHKQEFETALRVKLQEISDTCKQHIDAGIDYKDVHFSYTLEDQTNIKSALELSTATGLDSPYHADECGCRLFTKEDVTNIYVINQTNLTHIQTYANQLKMYIRENLTTAEEINSVTFGQDLTGSYLETYGMIMAQSKKIIATYLGVDEEAVDLILSSTSTSENSETSEISE